MNLEELGYDDWFRVRLGENLARETNIARVMAVERDRYLIGAAFGCIPAEITGRLRYGAVAAEDLPCVGDWVLADYLDNGQHAIVHDALPRRTILRRRSSGTRVEYQPIAANIDVALPPSCRSWASSRFSCPTSICASAER
ncbi:MAG: hypothetical protein ACLQCB_03490 [Spirochaetia bacterium]